MFFVSCTFVMKKVTKITGRENQNRALRGDHVAIRILDESQWEKNEKNGDVKVNLFGNKFSLFISVA